MKQANEIVRTLMDSPKWCAYTVGEYPNQYAHFIWGYKLHYCDMFKLSIPLAPGNERRPDFNKDWKIRILLKNCANLVYVDVPKQWAQSFDKFMIFLQRTIEDCNDAKIMEAYVSG
jgi:hypothetical protein